MPDIYLFRDSNHPDKIAVTYTLVGRDLRNLPPTVTLEWHQPPSDGPLAYYVPEVDLWSTVLENDPEELLVLLGKGASITVGEGSSPTLLTIGPRTLPLFISSVTLEVLQKMVAEVKLHRLS